MLLVALQNRCSVVRQVHIERVRYLGITQRPTFYVLYQNAHGQWCSDVLADTDLAARHFGPYPSRGDAITAAESSIDQVTART